MNNNNSITRLYTYIDNLKIILANNDHLLQMGFRENDLTKEQNDTIKEQIKISVILM